MKGNNKNGKLILVTSINPTPYGEGKTTVSIGINDALKKGWINEEMFEDIVRSDGKIISSTYIRPSENGIFPFESGSSGFPDDYSDSEYSDLDYCAINKFNFAVQANGNGGA